VVLNFHTVTYLLADRPEARNSLENVIEQARHAITEARNAIEGLRSSKYEGSDLEGAISRFGQHLAANQSDAPPTEFQINVEGATRRLAPILGSELNHIAIEALRNAFHHAKARRIEVEIRYGAREFRLRVRDNGKGIDQKILEAGRVGHYGMTGMRERARLAGCRLVFWSELDSGTELELTIPASLAYTKDSEATAYACRKGTQDARMTNPIRIMAADDHVLLRKGIAAIIASQPDMSLVAEASNGREAVEQYRTHRPDITLMDLQMPEMNGLDAMIAIRAEFPEARIIVLTT
jgi:two-component sensor histidine kinase